MRDRSQKPVAHLRFLSILCSPKNYDLVNNILERRRSGGYIRLIEANFNPQATEQAIKERLATS